MAKLGPYIREIDIRNVSGSQENLLGVSVSKEFIPSIANTIGTDWKKYKKIRKGQFCYIPDTSRRGDKIGIALLEDYDEALVSQAYTVFETDKRALIPEYLLLWFKREEFDRYARFMSHGSVREIFTWEKFCEIDLPIPSLEKQKEIVKQYYDIKTAIENKEAINNNLFQSGKTFIRVLMDKHPDLFDGTITLEHFCSKISSGGTPNREIYSYYDNGTIPWLKNGEIKNNIILATEEYITQEAVSNSSAKFINQNSVSMAMYCVSDIQVSYNVIPITTNQAVLNFQTYTIRHSCFLYYLLAAYGNELTTKAFGSAQQNLSKDTIKVYSFLNPLIDKPEFDYFVSNINNRISVSKEINTLIELQKTIISSMVQQ